MPHSELWSIKMKINTTCNAACCTEIVSNHKAHFSFRFIVLSSTLWQSLLKYFTSSALRRRKEKRRRDMRKLHESQKSAQRQNSSKRLKDFIMLKMGRNSAGCVWGGRRALVLSQHRGECVEWSLNPVASLTANRWMSRVVKGGEKQRKGEQKKKEGKDNLWAFFAEVLQFPHTYEALVNHNI